MWARELDRLALHFSVLSQRFYSVTSESRGMFLRRGYGRPLDPCMSYATAMMYANVDKREEVMLAQRRSA
jgi:hypothetical protein